jgi:hypothetical protein
MANLGKRSWQLGRSLHKALLALDGVAGINPSGTALAAPLTALLTRVVGDKPRLSLRSALSILAKLDVAAFEEALGLWQKPTAPAAVSLFLAQRTQLGDGELLLRLSLVLADRPTQGGSELSWTNRWLALKPHLERAITDKGENLRGYLQSLSSTDPYVGQRLALMSK